MVELLEHAEWVRGLATRLVREDADDAAQDVGLAALRSPVATLSDRRLWQRRVTTFKHFDPRPATPPLPLPCEGEDRNRSAPCPKGDASGIGEKRNIQA